MASMEEDWRHERHQRTSNERRDIFHSGCEGQLEDWRSPRNRQSGMAASSQTQTHAHVELHPVAIGIRRVPKTLILFFNRANGTNLASGKLIRHTCFDEIAMSMPQEFELKLECDPNNAGALKRLLAGAQSGNSHTETLNSVYFDTDDK